MAFEYLCTYIINIFPSLFFQSSDSEEVKWQMKQKIRTCAVCKIYLSHLCKYMDVMKDQPPHTRCFYDRAEREVTTNKGVGLGLQEIASYSSSEEKGNRLFKYFLSFRDIRENNNAFKCSKCWAAADDIRARSVFLELSGKGYILSSDYQMLTSGKI